MFFFLGAFGKNSNMITFYILDNTEKITILGSHLPRSGRVFPPPEGSTESFIQIFPWDAVLVPGML